MNYFNRVKTPLDIASSPSFQETKIMQTKGKIQVKINVGWSYL
jgi:hypothetical protein